MEEEIDHNKLISIVLALSVGVANACQTINAKFMMKTGLYKVHDITADIGFQFACCSLVLAIVFYFTGSQSINWDNFLIIFFTGILGMLCWILGQNACVKGLAGPALSIIYTNCFFITILQVVIQGLVPSLEQFLAALVTFGGILLIIFLK